MPEIATTVGFDLTLKDGSTETIPAGKSTVSEEAASHWFTQAHMVGVPRGRMPLVQGEGGMMIEADEAGQRVTPVGMLDPNQPPVRQEGPVAWSKDNPMAQKEAEARAKDTGTQPSDPVDGRKEAAAKSPPDKAAMEKAAAEAVAKAAAATAGAPGSPSSVMAATARTAAAQAK